MKRFITHALVACVALAALAGCADDKGDAKSSGKSEGAVAFTFGTVGPTITMLPWYIADSKGFFKEAGVKPTFVTVPSGSAMVSGLTAGQLEVIPNPLSTVVKLRQGGQDARMIAGQVLGYNYLIYGSDKADLPQSGTFEEKMKALEGLTIGVPGGAEGSMVAFTKALMRLAGANPDTLKFANVAFGGPEIAALRSGEVEAVIADEATVVTADQIGLGSEFFSLLSDPPQEYQHMMTSGSLATDSFVAKNPTFPAKYVAAMSATFEWMADPANVDEMYRIATKVQGIPESPGMKESIATFHERLQAKFDQAELDKALAFLYSSKQVSVDPKVEAADLFDPGMIG